MSKQTHLSRQMESRHVLMISLGGVIGTGLFLSSGYTIHQAGPIGTLLAYTIGAILVYLVMLCLGELSVAMPYTGAFHVYAKKYIGPGTGFTVAILYWLTWTIALGSEFTAAGLIMQTWFPHIATWIWSLVFMVVIFTVNALSVRWFAESEFWFASIKVIAIVAFIVLGGLAMVGILPLHGHTSAPFLSNYTRNGWFPNGFGGVFTTMLTVNFAFSGTELIGITAGETKDPAHTIPTAIKTTLWRLIIFFIGSMFVMAALIPYKQAGVTQSPFVLVFKAIGIPYAADLMNFVVLTAIMSAANSGLYASTRMLWSLANEGTIPKVFKRTTKRDVPLVALITSMLGGILALLSSVYAAGSVYLVLVSISGLAVVIVWMAIALSEINFRKAYLKSGQSLDQLTFKTPGYPVVPWLAFILSGLSCILIWFDPNQRIALYYTIPFVAICYLGYYLNQRYRRTHAAK
ncbi:amino acid permease [Lactiplantibacillus plantarum]|uniref:amino acid permease n=1 Tax=Lactiplantibacillus plantarum TaxID=1590 RepID=UPI000FF8E671|nr:amino acid permease [Lactiplantibacillus plantarum]MBP5833139.1 amino acid permease [Lactiplantibacillus plantarum]QAR88845.1 amino acid permease [Lactiplantibacillus plantarum]